MASTAARLDAAQVEDKRNLRRVVAASFTGIADSDAHLREPTQRVVRKPAEERETTAVS
ncbi:MAG: hypothetical protein ABI611_04690 [Solirubrobacteraceae bacterium]